jgi:hypothetical protein
MVLSRGKPFYYNKLTKKKEPSPVALIGKHRISGRETSLEHHQASAFQRLLALWRSGARHGMIPVDGSSRFIDAEARRTDSAAHGQDGNLYPDSGGHTD